MFMISTNRKNNRITIEEDGYLPAYSAYEQGAMTYKVSMKLTDFEGLLPMSVLGDIRDDEIEEAANDDVNYRESKDLAACDQELIPDAFGLLTEACLLGSIFHQQED